MSAQPSDDKSPKSAVTTLWLCLLFGLLGVHRFYVGKTRTAILMFATLGCFGLWTLIDLVLIVCGEFQDSDGRDVIFWRKGESPVKLILGIVALVIGIIAINVAMLMALVFYLTGALTDVVRDQLVAIRAGDLKTAYSYNSSGFRSETSLETFEDFVSVYPIIKNNTSSTFMTREIEGDQGFLQGTIYGEGGQALPIEYRLVYEDHHWKILAIRIEPVDIEESEALSQGPEAVSTKDLTYVDEFGKYTINYPETWYQESSDKYSVLFSGVQGTPAYASTITIQVLPMKKAGGIYKNVKEVVADLKEQINSGTTDVKFIQEGEALLPTDPEKYHGEFFEVSYSYKAMKIKKMQYVIVTPDGDRAYSWGYTTDAERYDTDLPVAKAMYESWSMQK